MRRLVTLGISLAAIVGISASSFAGSMSLMGVGKPAAAGGGGGPLTFTWTDSGEAHGTPAPPQAFTGKAISTQSADRIVVVTISVLQAGLLAGCVITSVTVDPNASGSPVSLTQDAIGGGGTTNARAEYVFRGLVTGAGTTATIAISGYSNGFITSFAFNVGVMKGSATASVASTLTTPTYPSGVATNVTVPANGVSVISTYSDNDAPTTGVTTTYNSAAADKDQTDNASFGLTGSMYHLTGSATPLTVASTTSSAFGWIAVNYQP
jgi:hypothetical protein